MSDQLRFKYKHLDDQGNEQGFFSKKARFDGTTLVLDKTEVPIEAVLRTRQRFNRLLLEIVGQDEPIVAAIAITKGDAGRIAGALNRRSSARWAELRREALVKEGKGSSWRTAECPACACTVDLTEHDRSPQLHCPYCDAVGTIDEPRPVGEAKLRICEQCGYYAMPRPFTAFYFYFLLAVWGYRYQKTYRCHSCMRKEAWKMLAANLLFVLGVPMAITQLIRAYKGGDLGARDFAGLDAANALAKGGKAEQADERYQRLADALPAAAGVHYCRGLAWSAAEQWDRAATAFEASLTDCANYVHAAGALAECYRRLGRQEKLARLEARWKSGETAA